MIGIVADDFTGAADVASMTAAAGLRTHVLLLDSVTEPALADTDVVVIDTESRHLPPAQAYDRVRQAMRLLAGADRFYKKICSAFRGNVGAEIDAALDELGLGFTAVVPAFPAQGRVTRAGRHFIHGQPLEQTEMAADPLCPMTDSLLPRVLQRQTGRRVCSLNPDNETALAQARAAGGMGIVDVHSDADLARVAQFVQADQLACGASALAGALARTGAWGEPSATEPVDTSRWADGPTLVVSGSVSAAAHAQIEHLAANGCPCVAIAPQAALGSDAQQRAEVERVLDAALARPARMACIHLPASAQVATETQALARSHGIESHAAADRVAGLLAQCAREAVERGGFSKLILFGGASAVAVCRGLGIVGLRVLGAVEPGVAWGVSLGERELLLALKPGSFGAADFGFRADAAMSR